MTIPRFTIRVYGLLIDSGRVLVSDEMIKGRRITKFPGGGLQYGEGLKGALVREIQEEMGLEALRPEHFYTTDFFQQSAFHQDPMQVVSVYYTFQVREPGSIEVVDQAFAGQEGPQGKELFRWMNIAEASEDALTLSIDQVVLRMLQNGDRSNA